MYKYAEFTVLAEGRPGPEGIFERLEKTLGWDATERMTLELAQHWMSIGPLFGEIVFLDSPFTILNAGNNYDVHSDASPFVQDAFGSEGDEFGPRNPLNCLDVPYYEGPLTVWAYAMIDIGGGTPSPYLIGQRRTIGQLEDTVPATWDILFG